MNKDAILAELTRREELCINESRDFHERQIHQAAAEYRGSSHAYFNFYHWIQENWPYCIYPQILNYDLISDTIML